MNIFQHLFHKKPESVEQQTGTLPFLTLLMKGLPSLDAVAEEVLCDDIKKLEVENTPYVKIKTELNEAGKLMADISFNDHTVHVLGSATQIPKETQRVIDIAPVTHEEKQRALTHDAQVSLTYAGQSADPVEQYIALYKVAHAFLTYTIVGVLNEPAWLFHGPEAIQDIVRLENIKTSRGAWPVISYWISFLPLRTDHGLWFFTKGNHIFGMQDFAIKVSSLEQNDTDKAFDLFVNFFHYVRRTRTSIAPGTTLDWGEGRYALQEVAEEKEWLQGPKGTIVFEKAG